MTNSLRVCLVFIFLSVFVPSSWSQKQVQIPRLKGELKFDGVVNDPCWDNIKPLPMVMHTPTFGNEPSEKSEVMICYDNSYLYVGARLFDSDPSDMLITSKKRDELRDAGEELMLIFDTFNDKENGLGFATTPTGLRSDFTISRDAIGGNPHEGPFNLSWNTFWDVRTTKDDRGWYTEMRIPFTSLRFKEDNGKVIMGLICIRSIAHLNEVEIYPAIPPNWGRWSAYRPSKAQEIEFEGLKSKKPFYIAPYAIGGYQQDNILNSTETAYDATNKPRYNAGLDVKYGLTNNLTLDFSLNTDFAQVEADAERINLTRFSLFFPEKRTFFQERSSVFMFDFERGSSLFYSRRIGLNETEQVPIYAGARITGMIGKWDIGFMDMQTHAYESNIEDLSSLPSENFGIFRMRRQVINENSYVGGIVTSRVGVDGTYNTAYGLDGIIKVAANDYLNVKVAQVMSNIYKNNMMSLDPTKLYVNWSRINQKGLNYGLTFSRSGEDFDPGIGFQMRTNYTHFFGSLGYGWIPGESAALENHQVRGRAMIYTDNADGSTQSSELSVNYNFSFKSGYSGVFSVSHQYENVVDTFSFSDDCYVPPGRYAFNEFETHLNSPRSNKFIVGLDGNVGTFYGGSRITIGGDPSLNIGSGLQLGLKYEHNFLRFTDREQSFSGGIAGFKAMIMFTTKLSLSTFIQYNTAENTVLTNIRFRYNPSEGNDLYVVFNEGRNTYRPVEDPRLPLFNNRLILVKYTYTFTL
jgi:hypothetical protein